MAALILYRMPNPARTGQPNLEMCDDSPREYDTEYTTAYNETTRRRVGYSHKRGSVTRFVVQLEYRHDEAWRPVVRYDHDPASKHGHDVTADGLHLDVFRNGRKYRTDYIMPVGSADIGLDIAEAHLAENVQRFIRRFEQWHEIKNR